MTETVDLIAKLLHALRQSAGDPDSLNLPEWRDEDWELLLARAERLEIADGEVLLRRGDTSNDLYFLVEGRLEVSIPRTQSMSMSPLISIGPGSVVGELSFFDNHGRSASVWSRKTSVLLRLRQSAFREFMEAHPRRACDLLLAIGRILAERLRKVQGTPGASVRPH